MTPDAVNGLIDELVKITLEVAALILAPLAVALVAKLLQRFGLTLELERRAQVEYIVRQAILRAEETVERLAKGAAIAPAAKARTKLDRAATAILEKLPGMDRDEAENLVHTILPELGLGAAAAAKKVRLAIQS